MFGFLKDSFFTAECLKLFYLQDIKALSRTFANSQETNFSVRLLSPADVEISTKAAGDDDIEGLAFHDTFDSQIDESVWTYVHPPSHRSSNCQWTIFIGASNDWTQGSGVATKDIFPTAAPCA